MRPLATHSREHCRDRVAVCVNASRVRHSGLLPLVWGRKHGRKDACWFGLCRGEDAARPPLSRFLQRCHAEIAGDSTGAVADYIPELAKADPDHFGISVATTDGYIYEVGDSAVPFTIQSISKAFVFCAGPRDDRR